MVTRMQTMKKKLLACFTACMLPALCMADSVTDVRINKDNKRLISQFTFIDSASNTMNVLSEKDTLVAEKTSQDSDYEYTRYQQYYQNIKVVGRSLVAQQPLEAKKNAKIQYTGKLAKGLSLDVDPYYVSDAYREEVIEIAKTDYLKQNHSIDLSTFTDVNTQPIIWIDDKDEKAALAYMVSFRSSQSKGGIAWPHYMVNAINKEIIHQWNNIQSTTTVSGPGGNLKTGKYQYGQAGLPSLETTKKGTRCYLSNDKVRVISAFNTWSILNPSNPEPVSHICNNNTGDLKNGGYSPANDAFMFGNMVVDMYRNWYGQSILTHSNGSQKQLTLIVHVGNNYENAAWNGQYMIFGDGHLSYHPLVSLGVTSHELAHAFTTSNSDLLYFNQSGAINEAFSDMSAIAAEYYMMQNHSQGFETIYKRSDNDWLIGDRIAKGNYALRSMSTPHIYGSADCENAGPGCRKTWAQIKATSAQIAISERQSYIVHKGSGIFNRAFYNMVQAFNGDVRKVFHIMVKANMTRWSSSSDFADAACGVKQAAEDLNYDTNKIHQAFTAVRITPDC